MNSLESRFGQLTSRVLDGSCTDDERAELAELASQHPELAAGVVDEATLHALLSWHISLLNWHISAQQAELIRERYMAKTSVTTMAERLNKAAHTISSQLHRIRTILAKCIEFPLSAEEI